MKKLLIILSLFFSVIQSADQKTAAEVWVIDQKNPLNLTKDQINQLKEIIDDFFNKEALKLAKANLKNSIDLIKSQVLKKIQYELWYSLLSAIDKKDLKLFIKELIQNWNQEHGSVVDVNSKIWPFIDKLINDRFDNTVSFKCNDCASIYREVFCEIYGEVRIFSEFKKMNLSSKKQVIRYVQMHVLSLAKEFRKN